MSEFLLKEFDKIFSNQQTAPALTPHNIIPLEYAFLNIFVKLFFSQNSSIKYVSPPPTYIISLDKTHS